VVFGIARICAFSDALALTSLALLAACSGERAVESRVERAPVPAFTAPAPAPSFRLIVASDIEGVLEPCGCTSRPAGGLDRLGAAIAEQREPGIPTAVLVAGNLWAAGESPSPVDAFRAQVLTVALRRMGVDLFVPGTADLTEHAPRLRALQGGDELTIVEPGDGIVRRFGSVAIHVGVLRDDSAMLAPPANEEVQLSITAVDSARPQLPASVRSELVVWTGSGGAGASSEIVGDRLWIRAGRRTEGLAVVDVWFPRASVKGWLLAENANTVRATADRYVAVTRYLRLDSNAPRDPQLRELLDDTFSHIGRLNAQAERSAPEAKPGQATYVGSDSCGACHTPAYRWWISTPHGRAYQTLVTRKRALDLECVGCHVTGFEQPGGSSLTQLEHYQGVGCESCHGPGGLHAYNPQTQRVERAVPRTVCVTCHDSEHSDSFEYAPARARLLVSAHGLPPSTATAAGKLR
jgi:hypothetical protein